MGQLYVVGLGQQPEQSAVGVEEPGVAAGFNGQAMLIIAIERSFSHRSTGHAVDEIDSLLAYPVDRYNFDRLAGYNSLNDGSVFHVLENSQLKLLMDKIFPSRCSAHCNLLTEVRGDEVLIEDLEFATPFSQFQLPEEECRHPQPYCRLFGNLVQSNRHCREKVH